MSLLSTVLCKISPGNLTPPGTLRVETGKDIDRRTNTTVSRPGQFRVALRNLWSSTADGFNSAKTGSFAGQTWRTLESVPCRHSWRHRRDRLQPVHRGSVSSANSQWGRASLTWRKLSACRAGTRAGARARPNLPRKKTIRKQPLFWSPFGGGCEVQSTGARGASINKPDRKRRDRAIER